MNISEWNKSFSNKVLAFLDETFESDFDAGTVEATGGWEFDGNRYIKDIFIENEGEDSLREVLTFDGNSVDGFELYVLDNKGNEMWNKIFSEQELKNAVTPKKSVSPVNGL